MPTITFKAALKKLDPTRRKSVTTQLEAWTNEAPPSESGQIAENIANETALSPETFVQLLSDFADALAKHPDPLIAWEEACGSHSFAGNALGRSDRPAKLGRVCKFDAFPCRGFIKTSDRRLKESLTKFAGHSKPPRFLKNLLNAENLGWGNVIFATFNESDSTQDPFDGLPWDRDAIRTALGLGQSSHSTHEPYFLFRYLSSEPPDLPLHRPTIADAGTFSHFRPVNSSKAKWGSTCPIPPNNRKLPAKPELIHKQITGVRVEFPYEITAS
jgi:hypothetical protein